MKYIALLPRSRDEARRRLRLGLDVDGIGNISLSTGLLRGLDVMQAHQESFLLIQLVVCRRLSLRTHCFVMPTPVSPHLAAKAGAHVSGERCSKADS